MGELKQTSTKQQVVLKAYHRIGREGASDLVLFRPTASSDHATIRWAHNGWEVLDRGSRNGTWLNDERLVSGVPTSLHAGSLLQFGEDDESWLVVSDAAPVMQAICNGTGLHVLAYANCLYLESVEQEASALVHRGSFSEWVCERGGESMSVRDGDVIQLGLTAWTLVLPTSCIRTELKSKTASLSDITFHFSVSADEEDVSIRATGAAGNIDLSSRAYHYTLLTLARLRHRDAQDHSICPKEHGWIGTKELAHILRVDESKLNVDIFRIRKQLNSAKIAFSENIIERRRTGHQLRIGTDRFDVSVL